MYASNKEFQKLLLMLMVCMNVSLFADDLAGMRYRDGQARVMEFSTDNILTYYTYRDEGMSDKQVLFSDTYELIYKYGVPYLRFQKNASDWLVLFNQFKILAEDVSSDFYFIGVNGTMASNMNMHNLIKEYSATSSLREKLKSGEIVEYSPENMEYLDWNPWVEGVDGDGIGEKITLRLKGGTERIAPYRSMWIYNGFIRKDRPELYQMNGRVKTLRVRGVNTGKSKIINLLDTPNGQPFTIHSFEFGNIIEIEILEVYPGARFNDTCISCISTSFYANDDGNHGVVRRK